MPFFFWSNKAQNVRNICAYGICDIASRYKRTYMHDTVWILHSYSYTRNIVYVLDSNENGWSPVAENVGEKKNKKKNKGMKDINEECV